MKTIYLKSILCSAAMWVAGAVSGRADISYSSGTNDITTAVTSTVDLYGGVLNVDLGGSVTGGTQTFGFGIEVYGGTLNIYGNVMGGSGTYAEGINMLSGTVNIYSGSISGGTSPNYAEGISMTGGMLNIYGGSIGGGNSTYAEGISSSGGQINMYHGSVKAGTGNYAWGIDLVQAGLNLEGGTVTSGSGFYSGDLEVQGGGSRTSTADIYGQNFNAPAGPLASGGGILTGTLEDGTTLDLRYSQSPVSQIVLQVVPEPSVPMLGILAGAGAILGLGCRRIRLTPMGRCCGLGKGRKKQDTKTRPRFVR
jgi:hypothetical protein